MEPFEVISSEKVYDGRIIRVESDVLRMPDGKSAGREVVIKSEAAAVVPVDGDGNIIFVRQYRHAFRGETIEIPAGVLDPGEEPLQCAARELEEETGKIAGKMTKLFDMWPSIGFCTEIVHIYLAEDLREGKRNLDPDEFVEVLSFGPEEALRRIESGGIPDSKTIAGVLAYCRRTGK
ncbi:MAG: NUDIX hydrolase [Clostridiales bacterium]|jgi:ADP-ribose pyrophosphatase|nr:NUDIX hydrolase [Clostridiales bacterium]